MPAQGFLEQAKVSYPELGERDNAHEFEQEESSSGREAQQQAHQQQQSQQHTRRRRRRQQASAGTGIPLTLFTLVAGGYFLWRWWRRRRESRGRHARLAAKAGTQGKPSRSAVTSDRGQKGKNQDASSAQSPVQAVPLRSRLRPPKGTQAKRRAYHHLHSTAPTAEHGQPCSSTPQPPTHLFSLPLHVIGSGILPRVSSLASVHAFLASCKQAHSLSSTQLWADWEQQQGKSVAVAQLEGLMAAEAARDRRRERAAEARRRKQAASLTGGILLASDPSTSGTCLGEPWVCISDECMV